MTVFPYVGLLCLLLLGCTRQQEMPPFITGSASIDMDTAAIIRYMQEASRHIDSSLQYYKKTKREMHEEADACITLYYDKKSLRKIESAYCSDSGEIRLKYYYISDDYLFLHKEEVYQSKLHSDDRYYFYKDSLLVWNKDPDQLIKN